MLVRTGSDSDSEHASASGHDTDPWRGQRQRRYLPGAGRRRQYGTGPEIVTITGKVVWFRQLPAGTFAPDFRTQTYLGQPVLTWFQSGGAGGADVIYNDRFQQIATVKPANGYLPDSRVPHHAVEHRADPG